MNNNTVFVIGAGASKEARLSTGIELKYKIAQLLNIKFDAFGTKQASGDYLIFKALEKYTLDSGKQRHEVNYFLHIAWQICESLPLSPSIDNYIDSHRENHDVGFLGKIAIVRSVLEDEMNSLLFFENKPRSVMNFLSLEKTWYTPFFQLLTENCDINEIKERVKSLTFIIFNYDRCVEHFLYHAFQHFYRISSDKAVELLRDITIYHPYGTPGTLPWINGDVAITFGLEPNPSQLIDLSKKIKTFTEGTDPNSSDINMIRAHLSQADKIVFLGFAFHELNMKLIGTTKIDNTRPSVRCFATTYGISQSDCSVIRDQIITLCNGNVNLQLSNSTCFDFFTEFRKSLSFKTRR